MKKTIASLALLASTTSAFALIGPGGQAAPEPKTYCLSLYESEDGAYVGDCDNTQANVRAKRVINANGCADGQAAMQTTRVQIRSCPTFVQL